ncbi:MAG: TolC family protein [Prevotellaceae bacterium]|jgi:outer membrane protein TolC|nr:TolC family protein [Prevotellaceae bacterium]
MRTFLLATGLLLAGAAHAGDTLELARCWALGRENYPLAGQGDLLDEALKIQLKSLTLTSYFPRVSIVGEASYQSEVTDIGDVLPAGFQAAIDPLPKDHYRVGVNVQQTLFDANKSASGKAVERLNTAESRQMNEADMHALKQQIQQVYFTALAQQCYRETFVLALETLSERLAFMQSAVKNGLRTSRDLSLLEVEKLKAEKQIAEAESNRQACLKALEMLTGTTFPAATLLKLPDVPAAEMPQADNRRVEMAAFDTRVERLMATKKALATEMLPKVSAFGNLYYGRPGYNMLATDFKPFYMVGLRLSWIPWDGSVIKKEQQRLDIQAKMMDNRKAAFDESVHTAAWNMHYEVVKQAELLEHDLQIALLHRQISAESASRLRNGDITTSDYIADLNAEIAAHLSVERTKIQLVGARLSYLLILGLEQ